MHSNGLSPLAFPSLRRMEVEIVAMAGAQIYMLRAKTRCCPHFELQMRMTLLRPTTVGKLLRNASCSSAPERQ